MQEKVGLVDIFVAGTPIVVILDLVKKIDCGINKRKKLEINGSSGHKAEVSGHASDHFEKSADAPTRVALNPSPKPLLRRTRLDTHLPRSRT